MRLRLLSALSAVALIGTAAALAQTGTNGGRGGTMTLLAHAAPGSPDPQTNYLIQEWQFLINTHDGLTAFKRTGGADGGELVPDLAKSLPRPTAGNKTYTFQVRRGIRYSNGLIVKPSDFKRTLEREFKVHGPVAKSFYGVIVGAGTCLKKPTTCNLTGIVPNDKAYKVTFHLTSPDPEFLQKLAMPFAFVLPPGPRTRP